MIDDKNKKIIHLLQENGRKSLNEIGKSQDMSHTSIQKRLAKLKLDNIVRISAILNLNTLSFSFAVIIAEIEGHKNLTEIIEKHKNCPRLVFLSTMMGGHNIIAVMACEDLSSMNQIINVCSFRNHPAVRRSEVYMCDSPILPEYYNFPIFLESDDEIAPCGMNCMQCQKFVTDKCVGCPASKHYKFEFYKKKLNKK